MDVDSTPAASAVAIAPLCCSAIVDAFALLPSTTVDFVGPFPKKSRQADSLLRDGACITSMPSAPPATRASQLVSGYLELQVPAIVAEEVAARVRLTAENAELRCAALERDEGKSAGECAARRAAAWLLIPSESASVAQAAINAFHAVFEGSVGEIRASVAMGAAATLIATELHVKVMGDVAVILVRTQSGPTSRPRRTFACVKSPSDPACLRKSLFELSKRVFDAQLPASLFQKRVCNLNGLSLFRKRALHELSARLLDVDLYTEAVGLKAAGLVRGHLKNARTRAQSDEQAVFGMVLAEERTVDLVQARLSVFWTADTSTGLQLSAVAGCRVLFFAPQQMHFKTSSFAEHGVAGVDLPRMLTTVRARVVDIEELLKDYMVWPLGYNYEHFRPEKCNPRHFRSFCSKLSEFTSTVATGPVLGRRLTAAETQNSDIFDELSKKSTIGDAISLLDRKNDEMLKLFCSIASVCGIDTSLSGACSILEKTTTELSNVKAELAGERARRLAAENLAAEFSVRAKYR